MLAVLQIGSCAVKIDPLFNIHPERNILKNTIQ